MEADSLLDFLKAPDIFDLDLIDNGMIAGTRIEVFYEMGTMLDDLAELEKTTRSRLSLGDQRRFTQTVPQIPHP